MTNIKDLYAQNQPQGGGGMFLKTESGKTYLLRVLDLPVVFTNVYEGKESTKYAWPVYNHETEEVQILQKGAQVMQALNALIQDDEWGDPVEYDVKLSHAGTGMDTKYSIAPARNNKEVPTDIEIPDVAAIIGASPNSKNVRKLGEPVPQQDVVLDDIDDAPIDLDEIPFD